MASLKAKAKKHMAMPTSSAGDWRTPAAPAKADPAPPKYKAAYSGMTTGMGQMRHTTFHGKH